MINVATDKYYAVRDFLLTYRIFKDIGDNKYKLRILNPLSILFLLFVSITMFIAHIMDACIDWWRWLRSDMLKNIVLW